MGKPRQRAVDILGLQHQSGRRGSCASGRTSKESIVNGGRPTATLPVKDFIMANDCSIARMGSSTPSSEKLRHKKMHDCDLAELARVKRVDLPKAICAGATEITPKALRPRVNAAGRLRPRRAVRRA